MRPASFLNNQGTKTQRMAAIECQSDFQCRRTAFTYNHGWARMDPDAGSGPEVRKKIAHGETVGMKLKWNKPRRGDTTSTRNTRNTRTGSSILNRSKRR